MSRIITLSVLVLAACSHGTTERLREQDVHPRGVTATVAADFGDHQATGVAVSKSGRVFVSFPRWSDDVPLSVAELKNGKLTAYPNAAWNTFTSDPKNQFVCVQSVTVDSEDHLWVLDPASPKMAGVLQNGPKLVEIDLANDRVLRTIAFGPEIAPTYSYLNDVRIDVREHTAYITDSGLGGIIVVDLNGAPPRRVLADHASAKAEPLFAPEVNGIPVKTQDGTPFKVHADGIALTPDGGTLYYQALSSRALYKVATVDLRDVSLPADMLAARVSLVQRSAAADGLEIDARGRLFITDIEHSAVTMRDIRSPDVAEAQLAQSPLLDWPDSIAVTPDGALLVTASQIERMPQFRDFEARDTSYKLIKLVVP